jgi:SAM-dependent methyltransferase
VEGIDLMVRKWTAIPVREFNGMDIPYPDKSVDVVTFVDVLHHADSISRLLSEAHRVARRSIIIKDHLAESWFDHVTLRFMDWVGNAPHGVVLPYNYQSFRQWTDYFEDAALSITTFDKAIPLYPIPFSLLFGRKLHFIAELKPVEMRR